MWYQKGSGTIAGTVTGHIGGPTSTEGQGQEIHLSDPPKFRIESWKHEGGLSTEVGAHPWELGHSYSSATWGIW